MSAPQHDNYYDRPNSIKLATALTCFQLLATVVVMIWVSQQTNMIIEETQRQGAQEVQASDVESVLGMMWCILLPILGLFLALAVLVWKGYNWARITSIVLFTVGICAGLFQIGDQTVSAVWSLVGFGISLTIIINLALPSAAHWCDIQGEQRNA